MFQLRLLDIPVRIQPWFFLTAVLIGWYDGMPLTYLAAWVAVVLVGVLLHELGHALAGRAFGFSPHIELHGFGGLTGWQGGGQLTNLRDVLISVAGPAVGIVVGLISLGFMISVAPPNGTFTHFLLLSLVWVNLGWAVLNLLPILPLDGGRVAGAVAARLWGPAGRRGARWASIVLTAALVVWAALAGQIWIAIIGVFLALSNWQALNAGRRATAPAVD